VARYLEQTIDSGSAPRRLNVPASLTRVRPLVSLEMRALGVHLLASGERALVYPALRVGRTVLVAPRVVPVGHGGRRGRSCARVRVLRAGDRGEAIRRDGDQSANRIHPFSSAVFTITSGATYERQSGQIPFTSFETRGYADGANKRSSRGDARANRTLSAIPA